MNCGLWKKQLLIYIGQLANSNGMI